MLILLANDFCPQTYRQLLDTFIKMFVQNTPLKIVLHYYLTLMIEGKIVVKELADLQFSLSGLECDNGPLSISSNSNSLKKIIKLFHLDVILIYTALLLKRKIVVYHHSQSKLLEFMSALPFFVSHRIECPDDTFYPNLDLHCPEQIEHIKG